MTVTREAANQWVREYGLAWEGADPARAAQLFAEDCQYFETPFSAPAVGRDGVLKYWQAVPEGQADVTFQFQVLAVQLQTVIARWNASFTRVASGARVRLDGVFVLEFARSGLCGTLREWWHRDEMPKP